MDEEGTLDMYSLFGVHISLPFHCLLYWLPSRVVSAYLPFVHNHDPDSRACLLNRLARSFTPIVCSYPVLQYPTPQNVLKPKSMPLHYERLVEGVEKSLQGVGRPWWKVFFGIW